MAMASMLNCKLPFGQQTEKEQDMLARRHMIAVVAAYQPHASQTHTCQQQRASVGRAWDGQLGCQAASAAMASSTVLVICVSHIL